MTACCIVSIILGLGVVAGVVVVLLICCSSDSSTKAVSSQQELISTLEGALRNTCGNEVFPENTPVKDKLVLFKISGWDVIRKGEQVSGRQGPRG